jgi:hypothetical protein
MVQVRKVWSECDARMTAQSGASKCVQHVGKQASKQALSEILEAQTCMAQEISDWKVHHDWHTCCLALQPLLIWMSSTNLPVSTKAAPTSNLSSQLKAGM